MGRSTQRDAGQSLLCEVVGNRAVEVGVKQ